MGVCVCIRARLCIYRVAFISRLCVCCEIGIGTRAIALRLCVACYLRIGGGGCRAVAATVGQRGRVGRLVGASLVVLPGGRVRDLVRQRLLQLDPVAELLGEVAQLGGGDVLGRQQLVRHTARTVAELRPRRLRPGTRQPLVLVVVLRLPAVLQRHRAVDVVRAGQARLARLDVQLRVARRRPERGSDRVRVRHGIDRTGGRHTVHGRRQVAGTLDRLERWRVRVGRDLVLSDDLLREAVCVVRYLLVQYLPQHVRRFDHVRVPLAVPGRVVVVMVRLVMMRRHCGEGRVNQRGRCGNNSGIVVVDEHQCTARAAPSSPAMSPAIGDVTHAEELLRCLRIFVPKFVGFFFLQKFSLRSYGKFVIGPKSKV